MAWRLLYPLSFSLRKMGSHLKVLNEVRRTDLTLTNILFLPSGEKLTGRGPKTEAEHERSDREGEVSVANT